MSTLVEIRSRECPTCGARAGYPCAWRRDDMTTGPKETSHHVARLGIPQYKAPTRRRVRPNGLLAGAGHPPIFHALLQSGTPLTNQHVYPTGGAVETLARRLCELPGRDKPLTETFGQAVRIPAHETYGGSYWRNEHSEEL